MKSGCEFEELFEGYFRSDLSPAEELALQNHLKSCVSCSKTIEDYYKIHSELDTYKRPAVLPELLDSYHKQVDLTFGRETLSNKIVLFFNWFTRKRSPVFKMVQFIFLIILGIVVGWVVFAPVESKIIFQTNDPHQTTQPIKSVDIELLYYYLQASEMVLLEIQNSTEPSDIILNRELAQKLLIKTFRVSDIATQMKNMRLIRFLNRMELLLYDASNIDMDEMDDSLATINILIEEADLLSEVKTLQAMMKKRKEKSGA